MYKVKMYPTLRAFRSEESGIKRVIEAYTRYLPQFGFTVVGDGELSYDVDIAHAGAHPGAMVCACHGLYFTADYPAASWEWDTNVAVIDTIRHAREVTVPSSWVQEVFARDMRFLPHVVPHGIEASEWAHSKDNAGYVLWNKNRSADVCSPEPLGRLAHLFPESQFVTTFAPTGAPSNVKTIGLVKHGKMKSIVQQAGVYLSSTKETFGIGTLEAMAAGVPVLGFRYGGNIDLVQHGVNGYLARPGDYDDLAKGLRYCIKYHDMLSKNGQAIAETFTWQNACKILADVLTLAMQPELPTVGVVIPAYNKAATLERAVNSVLAQNKPADIVVIVDDGSKDDTAAIGKRLAKANRNVQYVHQNNAGVAVARNNGAKHCGNVKYLCFLDGDDAIEPEYLQVCADALEGDRSLALAYTRLKWVKPDGSKGLSEWPGEWNYDNQLKRKNQVPTCNVMRKRVFDRLGGYRGRYCPTGAGSEDAELWTRFGAYGYKAALVDQRPLFTYSFLSGHTSANYHEVDWLSMHPWSRDSKHPFASYASSGKKQSHAVRQYDEPVVSAIIPVGNGHATLLRDALDSLDSQTYRAWEAVVVLDTSDDIGDLVGVYPYVRLLKTGIAQAGAGVARNLGAKHARGKYLLFLDADDWLYPEAIEKMVKTWDESGAIAYSDYVGKAIIDDEYAKRLGDRLLHRDAKSGEAVIRYSAMDYDCERAIREPRDMSRPYIWNLITSLTPAAWHKEIGGFDESMESWEDWDYWIRMAKAGKCFKRIPEPLVVYRFYTGGRREHGASISKSLVQYLLNKYEVYTMGQCGCNTAKAKMRNPVITAKSTQNVIKDEDMVLVRYLSANRGQHLVVGAATGRRYNYHAGGDQFYVLKPDADAAKHLFLPIERQAITKEQQILDTPPPAPIAQKLPIASTLPATMPFDIGLIPGVTPNIEKQLLSAGIDTKEKILALGAEELATQIKGVGKTRAEAMIAYAKDH